MSELYARCKVSDGKYAWYYVTNIIELPINAPLIKAEDFEEAKELIKAHVIREGGTDIKVASVYTYTKGVSNNHQAVLELMPEKEKEEVNENEDFDTFIARVKRDGGDHEICYKLRCQVNQRIREEARNGWDVGRYLAEYGCIVTQYGSIIKHSPKAALRRKAKYDGQQKQRAQSIAAVYSPSGLSFRSVLNFARNVMIDLYRVGTLTYVVENSEVRDWKFNLDKITMASAVNGYGQCSSKTDAVMWLKFALELHGHTFGRHAYRCISGLDGLIEEYKTNVAKSNKNWGCFEHRCVIDFLKHEIAAAKKKPVNGWPTTKKHVSMYAFFNPKKPKKSVKKVDETLV
jgi:hypothetical protein